MFTSRSHFTLLAHRARVGYCRPCVAPNNTTITEVQPHSTTFVHKFSATPQPEQVCLFHYESNSIPTMMFLQVPLTQQPVPDPSMTVRTAGSDISPQSTNEPTPETPIQAQEGKGTPTRATRTTESTCRDAVSESASRLLSTTPTATQEAKKTPTRATKRTGSTSQPDTPPSTSAHESEDALVRATKRIKSISRPATAIHPPTQPPSTGSRKKKPR